MNNKKKVINLLPIILAIGFVPLLVHMHNYDSKLSQFDWFPDSSASQTDFFLYFKMIAIIIVALIMIGCLIYRWSNKKEKFKWSNEWFFLIAYAIFVFLSALFSEFRYFVFHGSYEVFESVWVVLGYCIFCFYAYQMIDTEQDVQFVSKYSAIGIAIVSIIGALQFFGWDLFRTDIGKRLITDVSYWPRVDEMSFTFPLKTSYTTLYNTNYLGLYFGLLIPIAVVLILFSQGWKAKIFYTICAAVFAINLVGSNSKSGLITLGVTFILACLVLLKKMKKHWWIALVVAVGLISVVFTYSARRGGISGLFRAVFTGIDNSEYEFSIDRIETTDSNVIFTVNGSKLYVGYDHNVDENTFVMSATYEDGSAVPCNQDSETGALYLTDEQFLDCVLQPIYIDDEIALQVTLDGQNWYFKKDAELGYLYFNPFGKYVKFPYIEKSSFFRDGFFSGRGELWNYIIPRLKNCLLLGYGSNTFAMAYPQDNYIVKKYRGSETLFDVKAHNFYFQQFLENGLLALLSLLVFYIWYFIKSFRLYFKLEKYDFTSALGLGVYLGTFTYMFVGIANDSNVCTAPIFWTIWGIGLAINNILCKRIAEQKCENNQ